MMREESNERNHMHFVFAFDYFEKLKIGNDQGEKIAERILSRCTET